MRIKIFSIKTKNGRTCGSNLILNGQKYWGLGFHWLRKAFEQQKQMDRILKCPNTSQDKYNWLEIHLHFWPMMLTFHIEI